VTHLCPGPLPLSSADEDGRHDRQHGQDTKDGERSRHGKLKVVAFRGNIGNDVEAKKLQPHHGRRDIEDDVIKRREADDEDGNFGGEPPLAYRPLALKTTL
jgi:hypothetical protein